MHEAPKEIYLLPDDKNPNDLSICWYDAPYRTGAIEYTRTDAFIEKACEFLDGCIPDYIDLKHTNVDTFMNVDNKRFIEDFRNYMKGE